MIFTKMCILANISSLLICNEFIPGLLIEARYSVLFRNMPNRKQNVEDPIAIGCDAIGFNSSIEAGLIKKTKELNIGSINNLEINGGM